MATPFPASLVPAGGDRLTDADLARRSLHGFGEMLAALGRASAEPAAEICWPDAVGARITAAADNPWFSGAVVPFDVAPPADDPRLPYGLWTVADAVAGRLEDVGIATPCMGVDLRELALPIIDGSPIGAVPLAVLGAVNERAYGQPAGIFGQLVQGLRDARVRTYGLREGGTFVCVALTLTVGDDVSIQYVATAESHRRRGLASRLLRAVLTSAQAARMRSATLQASTDGLSVCERLGFRRVATLRGYLRPASGA